MAVQAQYPSNVLLLNRNVQEGKNPLGSDYSLQPQPGGGGGGFLDQSHMLLNNGVGNNPRKRGREVAATTAAINPIISMQSQQPQLIDLAQLHSLQTSQPNVVSTGLRLSFGEQQQLQQQQWQQQTQQQQTPSPQSSVLSSLLSDDLATQLKQHKDEMENFLQAQGEQLRRTLAEKRQRHYRALLEAAEESVARRLREKQAEMEKAVWRHAELEARAVQLSGEAQAWQARARAQEATAATLHAQLQQAIMSGGCVRDREEGGEGGLGTAKGEAAAEDAESAYIDPDRVVESCGPICKACGKRVASVVLLPCRHLSLCRECDAVAQACPLCLAFKSSSLEVFLC